MRSNHANRDTIGGLALVKRIVDSAGGTIKAENREYGGCRFVVELPIHSTTQMCRAWDKRQRISSSSTPRLFP